MNLSRRPVFKAILVGFAMMFIYAAISALVYMLIDVDIYSTLLAGTIFWLLADRFEKAFENRRYYWKCPVDWCSFAISSPNDPIVVLTGSERHTHAVHGENED